MEQEFKKGDIVVVIKCPYGWHTSYRQNNAEGYITELDSHDTCDLLNSGHPTCIGDNQTQINYPKNCLRLATPAEMHAYKKE